MQVVYSAVYISSLFLSHLNCELWMAKTLLNVKIDLVHSPVQWVLVLCLVRWHKKGMGERHPGGSWIHRLSLIIFWSWGWSSFPTSLIEVQYSEVAWRRCLVSDGGGGAERCPPKRGIFKKWTKCANIFYTSSCKELFCLLEGHPFWPR